LPLSAARDHTWSADQSTSRSSRRTSDDMPKADDD
jgi:hypothetical protein